MARSFQSGRYYAGGDYGGLEQAKVILGEVEDIGQGGDVGLAFQVDARQPENGLVDNAEPGLDRRLRPTRSTGCPVAAANRQVNGYIEYAGPLGKVHAKKENVAPTAVREVHADGRPLDEDGERLVRRRTPLQRRVDLQRMVGRVSHAEHPLVAADRSHAAANLVGEGLEAQGLVGSGHGAGDGVAGSKPLLHGDEL